MAHQHVRPRLFFTSAALMALAVTSQAGAAPVTLATLAGSWSVAHVRTDEGSSRRTALPPDDPSLVGRTLTIAPGRVTLQTLQGPQVCGGAMVSAKSTVVSGLLAGGEGSIKPSAYGLPLPEGAKADTLFLSCTEGGVGPGAGMGASGAGTTWLLPLTNGSLAMSYIDGALLILSRGTVAASASFDCARAEGATERAICGSADLAGIDRSLASAYGADARQFQAIGDPAALAKLRASQKAWLRQRGACGGDEACLRRIMGERVRALGNTQAFTGE
jgi:uncharacterized protein YecT (DUF1311 family)